jgi:tetratricopeptide (TPR) repeat protein
LQVRLGGIRLAIHVGFIDTALGAGSAMTIIQTLRATVAATALLLLTPVAVQAQAPAISSDAEAGRALSQALNTLSTDPQNVRALIEAGEAALALDDPNGALGFFARAEEVDPRNGKVKAGLGRAMLMTEKPREALKLFNDAVDLGVPEGEIAGDRGLVYDLRGDSRRAQREYGLALRRGPDAEVTRRMALSLAIGGDREQAMQTLDPLLRVQDRAAWRARAFILAIGGDVDGANGVARTVMPTNLAQPMAPFFARLPSLSPSQKAAAVHFGRIPSDGKTPQTFAAVDTDALPPQPSARGLVPMSESMDSGHEADEAETLAKPVPAPVSREPRRRPGAPVALAARNDPVVTVPSRTAPASTPVSSAPIRSTPARSTPVPSVPMARAEPPTPGFSEPVTVPAQASPPERVAQAAASPSIAVTAAAPVQAAPQPSPPQAIPSPAPPPQSPPPSTPTPLERSLASIVQGLELEQAEVVPLPEPVTRRPVAVAAIDRAAEDRKVEDKKAEDKKLADKKAADKKAADKKAAEKKAAAKPDPKKLHPERIWAQIATGSSKSALVTDYGKLVKKSPAAFKGMTGWSVPFKATRRLLVGPFASEKKAEDFLKKAGITGFAWNSPAGTEIEKLGGR